MKRTLGRGVLLLSGLRHMIELQPYDFEIYVDGTHHRLSAAQTIIANAGILGIQPFRLGWNIHPDDGCLEIIAMKGKSAASFVAAGVNTVMGIDRLSRNLVHLTGKNIIVKSEKKLYIRADGETMGSTPVEIDLVPSAVHVIIPVRKCISFISCGAPVGRSLFRTESMRKKRGAEGEIRTPVV